MFSQLFTTRLFAAFAGGLAFLAPMTLSVSTAYAGGGNAGNAGNGGNGPALVAYGCAHETQELFRYEFKTDTYKVIGVVKDQFGKVCVEMGAMAYIPSGPNKGLYGAPTGGSSKGYLVKVDPLTAKGTVPALKILPGAPEVYGMTPFNEGGVWKILATDKDKKLYVINPVTGVAGPLLGTLKEKYGGLAMDYAATTTGIGTVYAVKDKTLYAFPFPYVANSDVMKPIPGSFGHVEALEFAFGDAGAAMNLPTVPALWTAGGALLGFSENKALIAVNPASGASMKYVCSIPVMDFESMVFMTMTEDGWGQITVNPHD